MNCGKKALLDAGRVTMADNNNIGLACCQAPRSCKITLPYTHWPRLAVSILSTMPTVDWVLLGSGESNKGQELGSLYLQLVCRTHLASFGRKSV